MKKNKIEQFESVKAVLFVSKIPITKNGKYRFLIQDLPIKIDNINKNKNKNEKE